MGFSVKDWRDAPETTTPISAAALEDMETRLSDWAKHITASSSETGTNAFAVQVNTGHADGARDRFVIENNAGQAVVDMDIRGAVLNVGDTSSAVSAAGSGIVIQSPAGDSSTAIQIYDPGSSTTSRMAFFRTGQLDLAAYGSASNMLRILAAGESNARIRFVQGSGGNIALEAGPGDPTAPDTAMERVQAGVWKISNAIQLVAVAAAAVPNNSVFINSTGGKLSFKDGAGATNALY